MKIYNSVTELVGKTPIVRLGNFSSKNGAKASLFAKLESFNPAGSVKDRIALAMIEDAENSGKLKPGSVIVEPTSGNTGIGLAAIAAAKGYELIITMPETMSVERRNLIKAYGAKVILTEGSKGMRGAISKAEELVKETANAFMPAQFSNPANPACHFKTTGPEIWDDMDGNIDIFVAGIGTGGTISGVGKYLKDKKSDIKVVGIEPESSPVITKGVPGMHKIQGIGAGFVPDNLDMSVYDEIVTVNHEDAFAMCKELAKVEAMLVGISAGAAAWVGLQLSLRPENHGKNIVIIFPDTGERYLSVPMFSEANE